MRWLHLLLTRDDDVVWARERLQTWLSALGVGRQVSERLIQLLSAMFKPGLDAAIEFGWDSLRERPFCLLTVRRDDANAGGVPSLASLERRLTEGALDFRRHGVEVNLGDDEGQLRALFLGTEPCRGTARRDLQHELIVSTPSSSSVPATECGQLLAQVQRALDEAHTKIADLTQSGRTKDEFLAVAYHDLRSPVSTAKGALEILESTLPQASDDQKHLFKIARKAFDTLVVLVSNLLSVQLLELYDSGVPQTDVDLTEITREVAEALSIQARHKGVLLAWELPSTAVRVLGDPVWVREIAVNVVHNAIKFTEKGGHVSVRITTEDHGAHLVVEDDGVGIPADQSERVFEKLTRLKQRGTAGERGTGLGLYVAKRWVDRLGGSIHIVARAPAGTRVEVRLPTA